VKDPNPEVETIVQVILAWITPKIVHGNSFLKELGDQEGRKEKSRKNNLPHTSEHKLHEEIQPT
jgi:hypothetical protein